uniref:Uncharacterized protein n=1 Tax=Timema cristinae TaxID=61476 RepID=A0A7R9CRA7_TIMCR|nr:unnamed protein product [Timema cristinae]
MAFDRFTELKIQENLTIQSHDFEVKLTIFAEASAKFLCFNKRWKLVGSRKDHGKRCQFSEDMDEKGYSRYRSVADSSYYVGFHSNGRPLGRNKARQKNSRCINFLKYDTEFSIKDHNSKIAGANHHSPKVHENLQQAKKKHQQNNSRNKQQTRRTPVRIRHKNHHRNSRRLS